MIGQAKKLRAMTILDAVLAIALFGIFFGFIVKLLFTGQEAVQVAGKRQEAARIAQEAVAAVQMMLRSDFQSVANGEYGLASSSGVYSLVSSTEELGIFTRSIEVSDLDYWTKLATITVSWMQNLQRSGVVSFAWKIYNWNLGILDHHKETELAALYKNSSVLVSGASSSIAVARATDWSRPVWYRDYNISLAGGANDVGIYRYDLYALVKATIGNPELVRMNINNLSGGDLSVDKTWTLGRSLIAGYFSDALDKIYLASTDPNEISTVNPSTGAINSINVVGNVAPTDIWVSGDKIFLVKVNDAAGPELEIYNTSGVRVGSRELGVTINKVVVEDNLVYLATASDLGELSIVSHDNCQLIAPYTCPLVRQYDMAGTADATALVKGMQNTWYLGRSNGSIYGLDIPAPLNITQSWSKTDIITLIKDLHFDQTENILSVASNRGATQELSFYNLNNLASSSYSLDLPGSGGANLVNGIIKSGSYVYAASNNVGPEIQVAEALGGGWDKPSLVTNFNPPTTSDANRIFATGTRAYMVLDQTAAGPEFYAMDVSNPASPAFVGVHEIGANANDVVVEGAYAYVATTINDKEIMVFDITGAPSPVVNIDLPSDADASSLVLDSERQRLMVATTNNTSGLGYELYTIDISGAKTVAGLKITAGYNANASINDMDFDAEKRILYLVTSDTSNELQAIDVNPAKALVRIDDYDSNGGTAYGVDYDESSERVYMSLANNGVSDDFYMFETEDLKSAMADWSAPLVVATNGQATSDGTVVFVDDKNYAYLGTTYFSFLGNPSLYVFDVTAPSYPVLVGSYVAGGTVWDVKVKDDYAYLATNNSSKEFQVVSMVNRASPVQVAMYSVSGAVSATGLDLIASTTYVGVSNNNIYAFDTSSTSSVALRGSVNIGQSFREVSAGPDYVVAATDSGDIGMVVVNVKNWNSMSLAASFDANNSCTDVAYEKTKDRVFLGCYTDGANPSLWLLDMQNPTSMYTLASETVAYSIIDMYLKNNKIYLTTETNPYPVLMYDLVNDNDFVSAGSFNPSGDADAIAFDGDNIYLAVHSSSAEFQVYGPSWLSSSSVTLSKSLNLNSDNYAVLGQGNWALVAAASSTDGLKVLDVSNTTTARVINTISTGLSYGLAINSNEDLYLSSGDDMREMQIFRKSPESDNYAGIGWFTSQPYNSRLTNTRWRTVLWDKLNTDGSTVLHLRTAPNNNGVPGVWTDWLGPTDASDAYTVDGQLHEINSAQNDGSNDQWLQYRMILKPSAPTASPLVSGLRIYYE